MFCLMMRMYSKKGYFLFHLSIVEYFYIKLQGIYIYIFISYTLLLLSYKAMQKIILLDTIELYNTMISMEKIQ